MLNGLTILDLSRLMPGPYCTMLLADLGARVIDIEPPAVADDITATRFPSLQRNKESLVLDLKSERGKAVFKALVARADAVVEGFRPGTLSRLGVDYEWGRRVNPRIVYASLTGYGQTGPRAQQAGHDLNFLAVSGLLDLMVPDETEPLIPAVQFGDMTGALFAALSLVAAVRKAERTGHGQHLDISLTDALAALPVTSFTFRQQGWPHGADTSPVGGGLACYRAYRTRDGRLLAVGALEATFFANLCRALNLEEFIPHQYEPARQDRIRTALADRFATQDYDHWTAFFADKDACVTGAVRYADAAQDPGRRERGAIRAAKTPEGTSVPVLGLPLASPGPHPDGGSVPKPGQHTEAILHELGLTAPPPETTKEQ